MVRLTENAYGKSRVRLVRVDRGPLQALRDLTVDIRFVGRYDDCYAAGDNRAVLPTDTMKNTVYALAAVGIGEPEAFGLRMVRHFLDGNSELDEVEVRLAERLWERIATAGGAHPHAFSAAGNTMRTAAVSGAHRAAPRVVSGLRDLELLKTTGSGFAGFRRDPYTTLAETADRILATTVRADWTYGRDEVDYGAVFADVRQILASTFAAHDSRSAQHTLWAMGEAVLQARPEVARIHLVLPNRHHLVVDLSPLGLENRGEIFVATEEPHGLIEGTLERDGSLPP